MDASVMVGVTGGQAGVLAMVHEAIKATGVIVRVEPAAFLEILLRHDEPLVVHALGGVFRKHHRYLTSYKGLAFYTRAPDPLDLPEHCERIEAGKISIPEL